MLLEEVLVTAQKRAESSQDVPISMQAFSSDFLQTTGVKDFSDLEQYTPGLTVNADQVTQPSFVIRNIGTGAFGIGTDPAVGIYIDGVYSGRSGSALMQFSDIERVEILKGPQGTLFGRNSAAGAIQVVTKRPSEDFAAMVRLRGGNYNKQLGEFMINAPVADTGLAFRLNGLANKRDGYVDNANGDDLGNQKDQSFRFSAAWDVSDNTEIRYTYDYNNVDQDANTKININSNTGTINKPGVLGSNTQIDQNKANNPWDIAVDHDVVENRESRNIAGHNFQLSHDFDFATLRYIASYREFESQNKGDYDGAGDITSYVDTENVEDNAQFYTELNFNGQFDDIIWTVGSSYYKEDGEQDSFVNTYTDTALILFNQLEDYDATGFIPRGIYWTENIHNKVKSESAALYGDATWQATEKFSITGGIRGTWDRKEFSWANQCNNVVGNYIDDTETICSTDIAYLEGDAVLKGYKGKAYEDDDSWTNISPRLVLNYQLLDSAIVYASATQGYKAGGFNSLQMGSGYDPEFVDSFELGLKSQWFDNSLRYNTSVFHYLYKDKQDTTLINPSNGAAYYSTDTGDAEGTGIDTELVWAATADLRFSLVHSYIHSVWTDRENPTTGAEMDGEYLDGAKHQANIAVDYDILLGDSGRIALHLDHAYESAAKTNSASSAELQGVDYDSLGDDRNYTNARVAWISPEEAFEVALWGENIFGNEYVTGYAQFISYFPSDTVTLDKPAYYGAEVIYKY
jgi:iron complex outermembrane receptor protein